MARFQKNKEKKQWVLPVETHIVMGAVCASLGLLLGIFLYSFDPQDSSWFYYATDKVGYSNSGGIVGAYIASFFFYYWGLTAYLLVPFFGVCSWMFWTKQPVEKEWDRLLAAGILAPLVSMIFYIHRIGSVSYMVPGGVIGQNCFHKLASFLPLVPLVMGLYLLSAACLIVIARMSFMKIFGTIFDWVYYLVFSWREWVIPALRGIEYVLYKSMVPFKWSFYHIKRIIQGDDVKESGQSVFSFEQGKESEEQLEKEFWQQQIQKNGVDKNAQKLVASPHIKIEENESKKTEKQRSFFAQKEPYKVPTEQLFMPPEKTKTGEQLEAQKKLASVLEEKLERFGVYGEVTDIKVGPVVTLFEYQPDIDAKVSKIVALEDDLALALEAMSVRIVAPIPGTSKVGFEVANKKRQAVFLRDIIRSKNFNTNKADLPIVLGHDTVGQEVIVDLADMPHLLVAGSTGSGKSVALNTLLISLLCRLTPDELKLIIVDPKRLEFSSYKDIPHLLFPIITKPHKVAPILKWLIKVMEDRYEMMAKCGARNIGDYKNMCKKDKVKDELPYIVLMIDELADLMIVARKEVEESIARLAQMARAAGIHLVLATQRPSVDVLTGIIKVNFPSRMSFRVTSKVDSRTILDALGAETLLGKGDMLFMDAQSSRMRRVHGAYITDSEITTIANYVRAQEKVNYMDIEEVVSTYKDDGGGADDPLMTEVLAFLDTVEDVSISLLQRRFKIGYNRSARIIEILEMQGRIMPATGTKTRKVIK